MNALTETTDKIFPIASREWFEDVTLLFDNRRLSCSKWISKKQREWLKNLYTSLYKTNPHTEGFTFIYETTEQYIIEVTVSRAMPNGACVISIDKTYILANDYSRLMMLANQELNESIFCAERAERYKDDAEEAGFF